MDQLATVRNIAITLATPCLLVALMLPQDVTPQLPTLPPVGVVSYRSALVRDWVAAVLDHEPGTEDEALRVVRRWDAEALRDGWVSVNVMVALLEDPTQRSVYVQQRGAMIEVQITSADLHMMAMKAKELLQRPGRNHFLKRAALLHADAALLAGRPRPPFNSSFLLPGRVFVLTNDGTQAAIYGGDVNWEFGRILLDGVANVRQDAHVREWYVASLAHMLAAEHFDNPHFEHALALFPRAADILFFNGCLHESLADPRVQTVLDEIKVPANTALDVKPLRGELGQAERLFRSATELMPEHHEARLRRGRTLARLERHEEAASELRTALAGVREPILKYYGSIFLGAEQEALSNLSEARALYEQAAALYATAQAPRLALSQLAHRTGDRAAAKALLDEMLKTSDRDVEDDPWWVYPLSCGRDADERMSYVYRSVLAASR